MSFHHLALFLHLTGVTLWVGGMVFIRFCLVSSALTTAQWAVALEKFFSISWAAIALIVLSGGFVLIVTGTAQAPRAWIWMAFLGTATVTVYASLWFDPWKRLCVALKQGEAEQGKAALLRISRRLDIALALAVLTATAATLGLAV